MRGHILMYLWGLALFFQGYISSAQKTIVRGQVVSVNTHKPIQDAIIQIEQHHVNHTYNTNNQGVFEAVWELSFEPHILNISKVSYKSKRIPIIFSEQNKVLDLGVLELSPSKNSKNTPFTKLFISDIQELSEQDIFSSSMGTQLLLQAHRTVFERSAAFEWSATFFKPRGLDGTDQELIINGVKMNSLRDSRLHWNSWYGLNDRMRSQSTYSSFDFIPNSFGNLAGTTHMHWHADAFSKGGRVIYSFGNRSYNQRLLVGYNSKREGKWKYGFTLSGSTAQQGYFEGTHLQSYAIFGTLTHFLNAKHRFNITAFYAPTIRGKLGAVTKEVEALKSRYYNPYWGYLSGKPINSRTTRTKQPHVFLSHFYTPQKAKKWELEHHLFLKLGMQKNSRLDYSGVSLQEFEDEFYYSGGGQNPDPTYYKYLPSYFLREPIDKDYRSAYLALEDFKRNGQIDWQHMYDANSRLPSGYASYILYDDVENNLRISGNASQYFKYNTFWEFRANHSLDYVGNQYYASLRDLLGASYYLDVDPYAPIAQSQSNLKTINRKVYENDMFKYHYKLNILQWNSSFQAYYQHKKWQLTTGVSASYRTVQRIGFYENGYYPGQLSFGKSSRLHHQGFSGKYSLKYTINPKMNMETSAFFSSSLPMVKHLFTNERYSNEQILGIKNRQVTSTQLQYNYQFQKLTLNAGGYFWKKQHEVFSRFYYLEDLAGLGREDNAGLYQEFLQDTSTIGYGLELGVNYKFTDAVSVHTAIALGKHYYANHPTLAVHTSDPDKSLPSTPSYLKNYRLSNGPQQVFGVGIQYRDPKYWWMSTQLNFFTDHFISISPYLRTDYFATDVDGQVFQNYDTTIARRLLQQEQFTPFFLWNIVGGKSFKIKKKKYLSCVFGVQNILNEHYTTGGYEQTRNSNYQRLLEDQNRQNPIFGAKYWFGRGTTFFLNTSLRF